MARRRGYRKRRRGDQRRCGRRRRLLGRRQRGVGRSEGVDAPRSRSSAPGDRRTCRRSCGTACRDRRLDRGRHTPRDRRRSTTGRGHRASDRRRDRSARGSAPGCRRGRSASSCRLAPCRPAPCRSATCRRRPPRSARRRRSWWCRRDVVGTAPVPGIGSSSAVQIAAGVLRLAAGAGVAVVLVGGPRLGVAVQRRRRPPCRRRNTTRRAHREPGRRRDLRAAPAHRSTAPRPPPASAQNWPVPASCRARARVAVRLVVGVRPATAGTRRSQPTRSPSKHDWASASSSGSSPRSSGGAASAPTSVLVGAAAAAFAPASLAVPSGSDEPGRRPHTRRGPTDRRARRPPGPRRDDVGALARRRSWSVARCPLMWFPVLSVVRPPTGQRRRY